MAQLVTNLGLANAVAAWVAYASSARYLQWGVGSGQGAASTDLASKTGTSEARVEATPSQEDENTTGDTLQLVGTLTAAGTRAITEVGVFDAAGTGSPPAGGNMGIYGDFAAVNLASGDSITFTVRVTLDQA